MRLAGLQNTLHDALRKPSILDALPFLPTSKIPKNDTGAAAATNGSAVYSGDFSQAMLGVCTDLIVEVLKVRYADSGQYGFTCWWRGDFQLRHPDSFNIQTGFSRKSPWALMSCGRGAGSPLSPATTSAGL